MFDFVVIQQILYFLHFSHLFYTRTQLAIASDTYYQTTTDAQRFIASDQSEMSENFTLAEYAPLVASLVSDEHESENELQENEATPLDFVDGAVATAFQPC